MINAWALAYEILEGTLDETYPIIKKNKGGKPSKSSKGHVNVSDSKH